METRETGTPKPDTFIEARALLDDAWGRAKKVYKEALEEAKKLRDSIVNLGMAAFTEFWRQNAADKQDALTKSKERSELAHKTHAEAKEQADTDHREAMSKSGDSEARKEADETRKGALKQAKKDRDEAKKDYDEAKKR